MKEMLAKPNLLKISSYVGGDQDWYPKFHQRNVGCGPTTASNILWYISQSSPRLSCLCGRKAANRSEFLNLMQEVFRFVTPGLVGICNPHIFAAGTIKYGEAHGISFNHRLLKVPVYRKKRPSFEEISQFISEAMKIDSPIAFLNLSNGKTSNLYNWHWVTIIGFDCETLTATICDEGKRLDIDLAVWVKTSLLGGAFVYFEAE